MNPPFPTAPGAREGFPTALGAREGFADALTGGDPRSLGRTPDVVDLVLHDPARLGELFDCVVGPDEIVRMRAANALEKVCRQRPEWFASHVDTLLDELAEVDQPSVQWHLAQMLGEVELTDTSTDPTLLERSPQTPRREHPSSSGARRSYSSSSYRDR